MSFVVDAMGSDSDASSLARVFPSLASTTSHARASSAGGLAAAGAARSRTAAQAAGRARPRSSRR
jgi:hypothetical protein